MEIYNYDYDEKSVVTLRDIPNSVVMGVAEIVKTLYPNEIAIFCRTNEKDTDYNNLVKIASRFLTCKIEDVYKEVLSSTNENLDAVIDCNKEIGLIAKLIKIKEEQSKKLEFARKIEKIYNKFWSLTREIATELKKSEIYWYKFVDENGKPTKERVIISYYNVVHDNLATYKVHCVFSENKNIELRNCAKNFISEFYDKRVGI